MGWKRVLIDWRGISEAFKGDWRGNSCLWLSQSRIKEKIACSFTKMQSKAHKNGF